MFVYEKSILAQPVLVLRRLEKELDEAKLNINVKVVLNGFRSIEVVKQSLELPKGLVYFI